MRIVIDFGDYWLLNLGDIAMLQACVRRLQNLWPNAEIQVITASPERLEQYCPGTAAVTPTVVGRRATSFAPTSIQWAGEYMWKMAMPLLARSKHRPSRPGSGAGNSRLLQSVRQADLVLSSGGGFINDIFWAHTVGVLSVLRMAQRLGKPTAMFGQGIGPGPLTNPFLKRLVNQTIPRLLLIGVREELGSVPLLRAHGVEQERIRVTGDDALLLAVLPKRPQTGTSIGLNMRVAFYSGIDANVASRAATVVSESARRHGAASVALPVSAHKVGVPLQFRVESDQATAPLVNGADCGNSMAGQQEIAHIQTPGELIERAAQCRVIVTASYHAAVFGLAAGVPTVCVTNSSYYDLKFRGLAAQFPGGGCYFVRPGRLFERELSDAIDKAWETSEACRDEIHASARAQVARGDEAYARLKELIGEQRPHG